MTKLSSKPVLPRTPFPLRRLWDGHLDLFLISFVLLFLELACIRWFASTVVFLTFFTNWVLMACILGMSVGCLAAARPRRFIVTTIPLACAAVVLAATTLRAYQEFDRVTIDVGRQEAPQEVFFGTEYRLGIPSCFAVPIEALAGLFYVLIALMFVGPGQVLGQTLAAIPNRNAAYAINLMGSLGGIAAFALVSWLRTPPVLWFAISVALCIYFVREWNPERVYVQSILATLMLAAVVLESNRGGRTSWSPYYKVDYDSRIGSIATNNIIHQWIVDVAEDGPEYTLPHLLNRDAGRPPFEDVLIIGAGAGNDVAAALRHGARHVDAVEIDPVLYELGRDEHPNHPYDDARVTVYLDDGRNFLRRSDRQYDLVVYALVDSLVLHSGYSSLRLESFLFTEEAFRDVRARLKPGGVFAMYNYYRLGWVIGRLDALAAKTFWARPLVLPLHSRATIRPGDRQQSITLLLAGAPKSAALDSIRMKLARSGPYWLNRRPLVSESINSYGPGPPNTASSEAMIWQRIAPAEVETAGIGPLPSDTWPFLYLRVPTIPALNLRGMAIIAVLSLAILALFAPEWRLQVDGQMFFLGAGFMLLETRGIVQLALVFGSTWVVNSVVIAMILVMALLANLYVGLLHNTRRFIMYLFLIFSLSLNMACDCGEFLGLPFAYQAALICAIAFAPVALAGVIFATTFRGSSRPDVAFGSNIAGVVLGGLCEYGAVIIGFDRLLLIAIAFYLLAALAAGKAPAPT